MYFGNTVDGSIEGFGVLHKKKFQYIGEFQEEAIHGFGMMEYCENSDQVSEDPQHSLDHEEEYREAKFGNQALSSLKGYTMYKGQFSQNRRQGVGYLEDTILDEKYLGEFEAEFFDGVGRLVTPECVYHGNFKKGAFHGLGIQELEKELFLGHFKNGFREGLGIIFDLKLVPQVISGWKDGELHGETVFFKSGRIDFFGQYSSGSIAKTLLLKDGKNYSEQVLAKLNLKKVKTQLLQKITEFEKYLKKVEADSRSRLKELNSQKLLLKQKEKALKKELDKSAKKITQLVSDVEGIVDSLVQQIPQLELEQMTLIKKILSEKKFLKPILGKFPDSVIIAENSGDKVVDSEILIEDFEPEEATRANPYVEDSRSANYPQTAKQKPTKKEISAEEEYEQLSKTSDRYSVSEDDYLGIKTEEKGRSDSVSVDAKTDLSEKKKKLQNSKNRLKEKNTASELRPKEKFRTRKITEPKQNANAQKALAEPKKPTRIAQAHSSKLQDSVYTPFIYQEADISLLISGKSSSLGQKILKKNAISDPEFQETLELFQNQSKQGKSDKEYFQTFSNTGKFVMSLPEYAQLNKRLKNSEKFKSQGRDFLYSGPTKILEELLDKTDLNCKDFTSDSDVD